MVRQVTETTVMHAKERRVRQRRRMQRKMRVQVRELEDVRLKMYDFHWMMMTEKTAYSLQAWVTAKKRRMLDQLFVSVRIAREL